MSDPAEPLSAEEETQLRHRLGARPLNTEGPSTLMERRLLATLDAARQSAPATEPCNIEPAFSQHEYAVDYCETHDRPAADCRGATEDEVAALLDGLTDDDVMYDYPIAQSGEPMDPVPFVRWDAIARRVRVERTAPLDADEALTVAARSLAHLGMDESTAKDHIQDVIAAHPSTAPDPLDVRDCECVPGHRCDCNDLRSLLYRILTSAEYGKMEAEGLAASALGLRWSESDDAYRGPDALSESPVSTPAHPEVYAPDGPEPDDNPTGLPRCHKCGDVTFRPESFSARRMARRCAGCQRVTGHCTCPVSAPEPTSEYGRLLAQRDRLIAAGADPADLLVPDEPAP